MYSIPHFKDLVYWFTVIYTLTIKYLESGTNLKTDHNSIRMSPLTISHGMECSSTV